ncbi:MAG: GNAT family N-acetyltransferase, partial [Burkholderiales bacterium]|nr:GNAT family N-acetyltransferase [Burkholderiales bacterium]
DYADGWAQVLRIELHVYTDNARAIALYRRFGFVQEGCHRGHALREGQYVDSYSMARLHPNPPRIAPWDAAPA